MVVNRRLVEVQLCCQLHEAQRLDRQELDGAHAALVRKDAGKLDCAGGDGVAIASEALVRDGVADDGGGADRAVDGPWTIDPGREQGDGVQARLIAPHETVGRLLEKLSGAEPPGQLTFGASIPLEYRREPILLLAEEVSTPQGGHLDH